MPEFRITLYDKDGKLLCNKHKLTAFSRIEAIAQYILIPYTAMECNITGDEYNFKFKTLVQAIIAHGAGSTYTDNNGLKYIASTIPYDGV